MSSEVTNEIKTEIDQALQRVENEEGVKILLAVESGSRAWGFPSRNSDYDIRFFYVHPPRWYLSIQKKRDILERPIENDLDISGWDLQKTLKLLHRSNPPLLEQLRSPIVYREDTEALARLRNLAETFYSPRACMHHYLNMAEQNVRDHLKGESVHRKKYFYILRPLLACEWIASNNNPVPMEFSRLLAAAQLDQKVAAAIEVLLAAKLEGREGENTEHIPVLDTYIRERLETIRITRDFGDGCGDVRELDIAFLQILRDAYGAHY